MGGHGHSPKYESLHEGEVPRWSLYITWSVNEKYTREYVGPSENRKYYFN